MSCGSWTGSKQGAPLGGRGNAVAVLLVGGCLSRGRRVGADQAGLAVGVSAGGRPAEQGVLELVRGACGCPISLVVCVSQVGLKMVC